MLLRTTFFNFLTTDLIFFISNHGELPNLDILLSPCQLENKISYKLLVAVAVVIVVVIVSSGSGSSSGSGGCSSGSFCCI